jgi:hypothetical protein
MRVDTIKKRLTDEFNFSEIYESLGTESFDPGNILLIPRYREQQRPWMTKAYNEWLRGDRTIVLICPIKTNCKYFKKYVTNAAQIRPIEGTLTYSKSGVLDGTCVNNRRISNPMIIAIYWKRILEPNFLVTFD